MLQYLNRIDSIMASTGELGDPTEFATGLLGQAAAGDASGFDDLLAKTRKARARLAGIQPPGSCMEHYRLTMRELSDSITLLKAVKRAIISMDSASLPELAIRGQALQSRVERLQALTRRLREHGR
jgi:hypothetical protein